LLVHDLFQSGGDERLLMLEQPVDYEVDVEFLMLLDPPLALSANGGFQSL
jgi:hypothetical protein